MLRSCRNVQSEGETGEGNVGVVMVGGGGSSVLRWKGVLDERGWNVGSGRSEYIW